MNKNTSWKLGLEEFSNRTCDFGKEKERERERKINEVMKPTRVRKAFGCVQKASYILSFRV